MDKNDQFILNEIIRQIQIVIERYNKFLTYYLNENAKLIPTDMGKQIMSAIANSTNNNVKENPMAKIMECTNINKTDLMLKYNLDEFESFANNNAEFVNFFKDPTIKRMSDLSDDYKWVSQSLIVNIDTYINMFFKIIFETFDKSIKGLNDDPKINFYKAFPNLLNTLDKEFDIYFELHSVRNNILHNGMIADQKLHDKLNLPFDIYNQLSMYLPSFDKVILYVESCTEIIFTSIKELIPDIDLMKIFENQDILQYLDKYRKNKS